jgi:8-oxo-dGTP pyrophosphatase MutT (NUDIX family)
MTRLPGLAVVHVITVTADGQVLMTQRSATVAYAPLHWSASFEEQVTDQDAAAGSAIFEETARRGLREEFGIDVNPENVRLISVILQMDNLNLAPVVFIETKETLEEIRQIWSGLPRPSHAWEAEAIDGEIVDPVKLEAFVRNNLWRQGKLHPTSSCRLAVLARWLQERAAA